jgi:hypothetical protein
LSFVACLPSSGDGAGGLSGRSPLLIGRADSCHSGLIGVAVDFLEIFRASKFCSTFLGYPATTLVTEEVDIPSSTTTTFTTTL